MVMDQNRAFQNFYVRFYPEVVARLSQIAEIEDFPNISEALKIFPLAEEWVRAKTMLQCMVNKTKPPLRTTKEIMKDMVGPFITSNEKDFIDGDEYWTDQFTRWFNVFRIIFE